MGLLSLSVLALALSLDGFGVGCAYGLKNTKLCRGSLFIIALITLVLMSTSLLVGTAFRGFLPKQVSKIISGLILIVLGIWQLIQGFLSYLDEKNQSHDTEKSLMNIHIKSLGIVVQVLKSPSKADLDSSGDIDHKEAILLGFALGIDAFITGFGVGLTEISFYILPIVAVVQVLLLKLGEVIGRKYSTTWLNKGTFAIPGFLLILLGVTRIF